MIRCIMEPEPENERATRHRGWWWMVLPLVVVMYGLGMAPLRACAMRWGQDSETVFDVLDKMDAPLNAVSENWDAGGELIYRYQEWWYRTMGVRVYNF